MNPTDSIIHVAKLGGSLLDLPDLPDRFALWRQRIITEGTGRLLVVVGGGRAADLVREADQRFGLSEEDGHWLAVQAMQFNTHLMAHVLPDVEIAPVHAACPAVWDNEVTVLVDPLTWLQDEAARGIAIRHRWSFTSDSIAGHIASRIGAQRLSMLKSTLPSGVTELAAASVSGVVDADFSDVAAGVPFVELVNLRAKPVSTVRLR